MSGEINLDDKLDSFSEEIGIYKNCRPDSDVQDIISIVENLEKISSEECIELAIKLNTHYLYYQRVINRAKAKSYIYSSMIDRISSRYWNDFGDIFGNQIRINMIANEQESLREYMNKKMEIEAFIQDICSISDIIKQYVLLLKDAARVKND